MNLVTKHALDSLEDQLGASILRDAWKGGYSLSCKPSAQQHAGKVLENATRIYSSVKRDGHTCRIHLGLLGNGAKVIEVFSAGGKPLPWVAKRIPYNAFTDSAYALKLVIVCEMVAFWRNKHHNSSDLEQSQSYDWSTVRPDKWLPVGFVGLPTALAFLEWLLSYGMHYRNLRLRFYAFRLQEVNGINGGCIVGGYKFTMRIMSALITELHEVVNVVHYTSHVVEDDGGIYIANSDCSIADVAGIMRSLEEHAQQEKVEGFVLTVQDRLAAPGPQRLVELHKKDASGVDRLVNSVKARKLIELTVCVRRFPREGVQGGIFVLFCRDGDGDTLVECSGLVAEPKKCGRAVMHLLLGMPFSVSLAAAGGPAGAGAKRKRAARRETETCRFQAENICVKVLVTCVTKPKEGEHAKLSGIKQIKEAMRNVPLAMLTDINEARDQYPYMRMIYDNYELMLHGIAKTTYKVGKKNPKGDKTDRFPFDGDLALVSSFPEDDSWLNEFQGAGAVDSDVEEELGGAVALPPLPPFSPRVASPDDDAVVVVKETFPIDHPSREDRFCLVNSHGVDHQIISRVEYFVHMTHYRWVPCPEEASIVVAPRACSQKTQERLQQMHREGFKVVDLNWILVSANSERQRDPDHFPSEHVAVMLPLPHVISPRDIFIDASSVGPALHFVMRKQVRTLGGTVVFSSGEASVMVAANPEEATSHHGREGLRIVGRDWLRLSFEAGMLLLD